MIVTHEHHQNIAVTGHVEDHWEFPAADRLARALRRYKLEQRWLSLGLALLVIATHVWG